MKLREFTRERARNFVLSWTLIYFFFTLLVIWFGFGKPIGPWLSTSPFWLHLFLLSLVLVSILLSLILMWKNYSQQKFNRLRFARNIPFYVVLIAYPLGVLLHLIFQTHSYTQITSESLILK